MLRRSIGDCYIDCHKSCFLWGFLLFVFFWGGGDILFISTNKKDSIKALSNIEGDK